MNGDASASPSRAAPPEWARTVLDGQAALERACDVAFECGHAREYEEGEEDEYEALRRVWRASAETADGAVVRRLVVLSRDDGERVALERRCDGGCLCYVTDVDQCLYQPWRLRCERHPSPRDNCWSCVVVRALPVALRCGPADAAAPSREFFNAAWLYFTRRGFT